MAQIIKSFTTTPESSIQATAAELTNGQFIMVWSDGSGTGIDAQFLDATGSPVGSAFALSSASSASANNPEVTALADGGFFVSYTDNNSDTQFGARFDNTGAAAGALFEMQPNKMLIALQGPVAISASGVTLVGYTNASVGGSAINAHIKIRQYRWHPRHRYRASGTDRCPQPFAHQQPFGRCVNQWQFRRCIYRSGNRPEQ